MVLPIDPNYAHPSGIVDFDDFSYIDNNRWDAKQEVGSTSVAAAGGELNITNDGTGTAGISYLPSKQTFGKIWRISSDLHISTFAGTHGELSLVLYKDGDYVKFGPYKSTGGTDENAYLRSRINGVDQAPLSISGYGVDIATAHTYTLVVLNTLVLVYYDGEYQTCIAFPGLIDYQIRIEGGTWDNSDIIDARAEEFEAVNNFDPLQMTIGFMLEELGTMAEEIYAAIPGIQRDLATIKSGIAATAVTVPISGTLILTDTTPVAIELLSATYGDVFNVNLMADLGGCNVDHCYYYDGNTTTSYDQTTEANNLKTNSIYLAAPGGPHTWDNLTVGHDEIFHSVDVYMEDGVSNKTNNIVWWGYYGGSWQHLHVTSDTTIYGGKSCGKSGRVTWSDDLEPVSYTDGITAYWVLAVNEAVGSVIPMASHIQVIPDSKTGFDARAAFLSSLYVKIYRKVNGSYSALPSDIMPFTQCILDRNIDISTFECWSDTKIEFLLSSSPVANVYLPYTGYVQEL